MIIAGSVPPEADVPDEQTLQGIVSSLPSAADEVSGRGPGPSTTFDRRAIMTTTWARATVIAGRYLAPL
jgi:hypothetical protein